MAKTARRANSTFTNLGFNPDVYAGALAHIIKVETTDQGRRETVLGQAWLAGIGKLVTCGHVVEPHLKEAGSLIVTFPYSGNRYPIKEMRLHPSYARQSDGLVKFDAALLLVELNEPELSANILPIIYEKDLPSQLALTAVRYPVHLGQYSSALNPLAQSGRLLGPLRKNDDFHLLHDTALAPGDSGAPIFDNESLVALHCGDTATLPGLNLPTTSIRLALWVDALRDLGIEGLMAGGGGGRQASQASPALAIVAFWLVFLATIGGVSAYRAYPTLSKLRVDNNAIKPLTVTFNHPLDEYEYYQEATLTLEAHSDCMAYLYMDAGNGHFQRLFPNFPKSDDEINPSSYTLSAGTTRRVDQVGNAEIRVDCDAAKLHLIVLKSGQAPLKIVPSYEYVKSGSGTDLINMNDTTPEVEEARSRQKNNPDQVLEFVFDSPQATKESRERYLQNKSKQSKASPAPNNSETQRTE
ncbi:MAG: trypsin-like peptidase domain-containing protein [Cyanobacteria bacterium SZAS TMP-1]|nr:trypsin-like peptidase domain-containing protein [Cyanobacteria bacterium SZAS TMP-1]